MTTNMNTVKTWRERIGQTADFPLHAPTDVERAMEAEIAELRAWLCMPIPPAGIGLASLTAVDCPACDGKSACDECHGQGKVIVARADLAALYTEHADSEGGHHD